MSGLHGPSDIDTIADVFIASFGTLTFLPKLHTDDETRGWIRDVMFPAHAVWVAETSSGVVGFGAVHDDLLGLLYVHPEHQGQGIGTALLDVVKRERPHGFDLWVFQTQRGCAPVLRTARVHARRDDRWKREQGEGAGRALRVGSLRDRFVA